MLFVAIVLLACSLLKKLSSRLGVPSLLLFIVLGMLMGSDGIFKIQFDNYYFAQTISSIALIVIMFTGGFETSFEMAKPVALRAIILSSLGTILSLLEGMLCGAVLASTDAASVFSILPNSP